MGGHFLCVGGRECGVLEVYFEWVRMGGHLLWVCEMDGHFLWVGWDGWG